MKIRRPTFLTHGQNRLPAFAQLFLVLAIGVASIGTGRLFPEQLTQIRQHVDDFFLPIHQLADAPIQTVQNLTSLATTLQHNIRLREELLQLQEWKTHAFALAYENEQLRDLLGVRTPQSLAITNRLDGMILARAVADRSAAGTRNLLLDKGEIDGITIDDVVFSNGALVGRIIQVGLHSSRLRLITDLQSRIPVIIGEARHRAVLFGD
ncbi:MAG: rod shape-determining protein MreC, partial [Pseudomonadota bacterium]